MINFDYYITIPSKWGILFEKRIVGKIVNSYKEKYKEALEELNSLRRKKSFSPYIRDRRTPEEFIRDLIEGWLVEDLILEVWLTRRLEKLFPKRKFPDFEIISTGTDVNRRIRFTPKSISKNVTTEPDFELKVKSKKKSIELQFSRKERNIYDMKVGKVKRAIKEGSIFLWYIQPLDSYFFVDPTWLVANKKPQVNFLWGGKMTYKVEKNEITIKSMNRPFNQDVAKLLLR